MLKKLSLLFFIFLYFFTLIPQEAKSQRVGTGATWKGNPLTGNWTDPNNWNFEKLSGIGPPLMISGFGSYPHGDIYVQIDGNATVTLNKNEHCKSVDLNKSNFILENCELVTEEINLNNNSTLTINNGTCEASYSLANGAGNAKIIMNNGTLKLNNLAIADTLTIDGGKILPRSKDPSSTINLPPDQTPPPSIPVSKGSANIPFNPNPLNQYSNKPQESINLAADQTSRQLILPPDQTPPPSIPVSQGSANIPFNPNPLDQNSNLLDQYSNKPQELSSTAIATKSKSLPYYNNFITGNGKLVIEKGITVDTNGINVDVNSKIEGPGTFTKMGAGELNLKNAATYTGGTFIKEGVLKCNTAFLPPGGPINIFKNATLILEQPKDGTFNADISGEGELIKYGKGVLTYKGNKSNFKGTIKVYEGVIVDGITLLVPDLKLLK